MSRFNQLVEEYDTLCQNQIDYDAYYDELGEYIGKTPLVQDVLESGVLAFSTTIADINAYKDRVFGIVETVRIHKEFWDDLYTKVKNYYDEIYNRALLTKGIRKLSSKELREAAASTAVIKLQRLMHDVESKRREVTNLVNHGRRVLENLDETNNRVSRQITVIQLAYEVEELQRGDTPKPILVRGSNRNKNNGGKDG